MQKTGDIYLASEKGRCVAYWRPADGSPERFLCAADAAACGKHPHLRELLIELAAEVALNRSRAAGDSVTLRAREFRAGPAWRAAMMLPADITDDQVRALLLAFGLLSTRQVEIVRHAPPLDPRGRAAFIEAVMDALRRQLGSLERAKPISDESVADACAQARREGPARLA